MKVGDIVKSKGKHRALWLLIGEPKSPQWYWRVRSMSYPKLTCTMSAGVLEVVSEGR